MSILAGRHYDQSKLPAINVFIGAEDGAVSWFEAERACLAFGLPEEAAYCRRVGLVKPVLKTRVRASRSLVRQLLRYIRFAFAIPILRLGFNGELAWWLCVLSYVVIWFLFVVVDFLLYFREQAPRIDKSHG